MHAREKPRRDIRGSRTGKHTTRHTAQRIGCELKRLWPVQESRLEQQGAQLTDTSRARKKMSKALLSHDRVSIFALPYSECLARTLLVIKEMIDNMHVAESQSLPCMRWLFGSRWFVSRFLSIHNGSSYSFPLLDIPQRVLCRIPLCASSQFLLVHTMIISASLYHTSKHTCQLFQPSAPQPTRCCSTCVELCGMMTPPLLSSQKAAVVELTLVDENGGRHTSGI